MYIHQDSCIYNKVRIYKLIFVYIQQDSRTEVCTKIFACRLRFVHIWQKGKRDRWIDYRVFKRWPKNGGKHGEFVAAKRGSHLLLGSPWQKKCLMKGHESVKVTAAMLKKSCQAIFKFPVLAPSSPSYTIHEWIMEAMVAVENQLKLHHCHFCFISAVILLLFYTPRPAVPPPPPFAFVETQSGLP